MKLKNIKKHYNQKKHIRKTLKKIHGNNIVLTEFVSDEDPYAGFYKDMREEIWNCDSNYEY